MSRRKVAALVGAFVVVLAAAIAITAVVVRGRDRAAAPAAPPNASTSAPTTPASQTASPAALRCGLQPTSADQPLAGATNVRWERVDGAWWLPISNQAGPAHRDAAGDWSCYSHDESGAVLAAYVISFRASGVAPNWQQVTRDQTVAGVGQQAHLGAGLSSTTPTTPRGFEVVGYTPERATIRYYLHSPQLDGNCTMDVAWSGDDWKLLMGDDGSTSSGCDRGAPDSPFTPWGP